jgi:hypothetical protein
VTTSRPYAVEAWPPPDVGWTELHLAAERRLSLAPATQPGQIRFPVRSRDAKLGLVVVSKTAYPTRSSFIHLR